MGFEPMTKQKAFTLPSWATSSQKLYNLAAGPFFMLKDYVSCSFQNNKILSNIFIFIIFSNNINESREGSPI